MTWTVSPVCVSPPGVFTEEEKLDLEFLIWQLIFILSSESQTELRIYSRRGSRQGTEPCFILFVFFVHNTHQHLVWRPEVFHICNVEVWHHVVIPDSLSLSYWWMLLFDASAFGLIGRLHPDRHDSNNGTVYYSSWPSRGHPSTHTIKVNRSQSVAKWSWEVLTWQAFPRDKDSYSVSAEWWSICSIDQWYWPFVAFCHPPFWLWQLQC